MSTSRHSGPLLFEREHRYSACPPAADLGHDVLTSFDAGKANSRIPDVEVLAFATAEDRILLSHNRRDFALLHRRRTAPHAGMILCSVDPDCAALAARINSAVASAVELRDQLIRINRHS